MELAWLAQRAVETPNKAALIYADQQWTFAELNQQVAAMAARLAGAGVSSHQIVAVLMPSRPEYLVLVYAIARLGATLVPLNTRLTESELRWQLDHAEVSLVICSKETEVQAASLRDALWQILTIDEAGTAIDSLLDIEPVHSDSLQGRTLTPGEVQAIIFTSGTTGEPKGAMITFSNQYYSALGSLYRLGLPAAERWLLCMPLYHVGGLSIIFRCCLYGTTVVLQDGFDVAAVSDALDTQGITTVSLVPTMLHRLLEYRGDRLLPGTLQCILLGGAAASPKLIEDFIARGAPVALTYGLTEACSQVATTTPAEIRAKPGSVGKPLMNIGVRIIDEEGKLLPHGEIGEIVVGGMTVMRGYFEAQEATESALQDGWLHTGDLGYMDADGDLWVVQRRIDLIITGGENVYPSEVEGVLEQHPDVKEVCVAGIEDAEWGQRVAALIARADDGLGEEDIIEHCRTYLAGYKVPRLIRFADSLPRTASGKIERKKVIRLLEEMSVHGA